MQVACIQYLDELDAKMIGYVKVLAKDRLERCRALGIDGGKVQAWAGVAVRGGHNQVQDLSWRGNVQWGSHRRSTG